MLESVKKLNSDHRTIKNEVLKKMDRICIITGLENATK